MWYLLALWGAVGPADTSQPGSPLKAQLLPSLPSFYSFDKHLISAHHNGSSLPQSFIFIMKTIGGGWQ